MARYLFVGGVAACVDIGFFFVFAKLAGLNYLLVATAGFTIGTLVNYVLSIRVVFQSGARFSRSREVGLVYAVTAIGLAMHLAVLFVMIDLFQIELMLSKVTATGLVFFWNFSARNYFIFRRTETV